MNSISKALADESNNLTEKKRRILEAASGNPGASPTKIAEQLEGDYGEEAPSRGYVYSILSEYEDDDSSSPETADDVVTLTISIPGQEDVEVDVQSAK